MELIVHWKMLKKKKNAQKTIRKFSEKIDHSVGLFAIECIKMNREFPEYDAVFVLNHCQAIVSEMYFWKIFQRS